jgi:propionate CoA-transferase
MESTFTAHYEEAKITGEAASLLGEPHAIHPRDVRVPGCFVDYLVLDPSQGQTYQVQHDPAFCGDSRKPDSEFPSFPLSTRKVVARRAALELAPVAVLNVGFGLPDGVIKVAREQGFGDTLVPTIEHGQFGGVPAGGLDFGATYNADAILETGHMFSFYHGRGVDQAYLGFLQVDRAGNVNVSKLGSTIIGIGGFIDIAQRARKLVFCGTLGVRSRFELTADGLRCVQQGAPKFVEQVAQVTFSGAYARRLGREVWYVTEAAVFRLSGDGIRLEEIAPGLDLERDILPQLGFVPPMAEPLRTMPRELFAEEPLPRRLFRHYAE